MEELKQNNELTYSYNPYYEKNVFVKMAPVKLPAPKYEEIKDRLPQPIFEGHDDYLACYDFTWKTAFGNINVPPDESGFVASFLDTAFNGCTFMWDSCYMMMFAKYANRIFPFQRTLDNFYAKQHRDGFICREIRNDTGLDRFARHDPSSTGPALLTWAERVYYDNMGDLERLQKVYAPLRAYHLWYYNNRTWRDGTYFSSGWGCGMDNCPRLQPQFDTAFSNGHMVWVDINLQQIFDCDNLIYIHDVLGSDDDISDLTAEKERLTKVVNDLLWDEKTAFYYDLWENNRHNGVKHIGAFWALQAGVVPQNRIDRFVAHLTDEREFNRPNAVPSLSADDAKYVPMGGYWRGSVWPNTNYMVLQGLTHNGYHDLAYAIGDKFLRNVIQTYNERGTVFENYCPERADKGDIARSNFVGWTGLAPIAVFFEYVMGIQPDAKNNRIVWRIHRTEKHGVRQYPFGPSNTLDLVCEARASSDEEPVVHVTASAPCEVVLEYNGKTKIIHA